MPPVSGPVTTGWPPRSGLRSIGWLDPDLAFTDLGRQRRDWIEARTDELAADPYDAIGVDGCARLRELVRPMSRSMMAAFA